MQGCHAIDEETVFILGNRFPTRRDHRITAVPHEQGPSFPVYSTRNHGVVKDGWQSIEDAGFPGDYRPAVLIIRHAHNPVPVTGDAFQDVSLLAADRHDLEVAAGLAVAGMEREPGATPGAMKRECTPLPQPRSRILSPGRGATRSTCRPNAVWAAVDCRCCSSVSR